MTELSPAAQKILRADAAKRCLAEWSMADYVPCHPFEEGWNGCSECVNRVAVAAALLAAADQVVPEPNNWDKDNFSTQALRLRCVVRDQILAIAAELKAQ